MRLGNIPPHWDLIWHDEEWRTKMLWDEMERLELNCRQTGEQLQLQKQTVVQYRRGIERVIPIVTLKAFLYQNHE
jgi:hypothetical protein